MIISITGITGNMGEATLEALSDLNCIHKIKLLCHSKKRMKKLLSRHKPMHDRIEVIYGGMNDRNALAKLVTNSELVINMAAVIPPNADRNPSAAIACNQTGTDALVSEIEKLPQADRPAFIHISTVALYGSRSPSQPFAKIGDPLLVSPLDVYSATKLRAEFRVLESDIENWAVLRQTAMLHKNMLADNVHDGLMFHTVFSSPLEWVTAHDSGILIRNIVEKFCAENMPDGFWRRCHNITGGKSNRQYGIQTFDDGFEIIGGSAKDFFRPGYSATRNFHGVWYSDGDELNDMFDYQKQTTASYWREVSAAHPMFKLGKFVPKSLIEFFLFKRLLRDKNSPKYWAKHGEDARITAHFGSRDNYDKLQSSDWSDCEIPDKYNIKNIKANSAPVYYGYDFDKSDAELTDADMRALAEAHGGKLLTHFDGDMYKKLDWQTQDGEIFTATAYTVARAGHWYNSIYDRFEWEFDRLAKKDKVFASVWYDSHDKDENITYTLDEKFKAFAHKFDDIRKIDDTVTA